MKLTDWLQIHAGWKEAIAAEHVKLVLPPDSVSSEYQDFESNNQVTVIQSSDSHKQLTNARADEASTATGASAKPKFRTKPDKGTKIKYIPKHRILTWRVRDAISLAIETCTV